jgi:hypothetical protein
MKISHFAAIVLGVATIQQANAVSLEGHDFDFADYELAEIDGEGKGDAAAENTSTTLTDADSEESVGGITLRLPTADCEKPKPEIPFDQQMLLALQELSGKSMTLYEALKTQFSQSAKLQNSKTMSVTGKISFEPAGDGPLPEAPKPCPEPASACPKNDVTLSLKAADGNCGCAK